MDNGQIIKKPKKFILPQEEESENYFSTSQDEVIDIEPEDEENSENSCIEEIFENKNFEDTFNDKNSEMNQKNQQKRKTKGSSCQLNKKIAHKYTKLIN